VSDNGRGDQPGWGTPGYGQQGRPPSAGGPGYGAGPHGQPPQQQPQPEATQAYPAPGQQGGFGGQGYGAPQSGQQYGGQQYGGQQYGASQQQGWPGGPAATLQGAPPAGYGGPPPGFTPPRKRRTPIIIVSIVVVIALVAGGFGIWRLLKGSGGADSPTAAIQLLASDLASNNYIDAFSRLDPAEANLAQDLSGVVTDQLVRLEILKPGAQLGAGSFQIADLKMDEGAAEQVRDNVVINKLVGGTITFDQGTSLPFTDKFAKKAFPDGMAPAGQPTKIDIADEVKKNGGEPIRIASVKVDGQWYVSLFYTAADYALKEEGTPWPKTSIAANGAASAEDAVKDTVQAALDGDARRLVELADPNELAVVHDTGDAIIAGAGRAEPSGAKLIELDTTRTDVRGKPAVQLKKAVIEADGERGTVERDGDCLNLTADGEAPQRFCSADVLDQLGDSGDPTLQRILPKLIQVGFDVKVVTSEVDGKYYVDPGQTIISLYGDLLGVLEPGDIDALLDAVN
jgi:hypothetical protein